MRISDWSSDVCSSDLRQRYDDGFKSGIYDRKTLDRRQHRNRRSDHAVAIKERCCEHAQHDDTARTSLCLRPPADEREQRKATALALIVRPHDDGDIFTAHRTEEHTSELTSLMRSSYAVFCLKQKN